MGCLYTDMSNGIYLEEILIDVLRALVPITGIMIVKSLHEIIFAKCAQIQQQKIIWYIMHNYPLSLILRDKMPISEDFVTTVL